MCSLFYGIGNCSCSSGVSTRIALAILAVQRAGVALFYWLKNDPYISVIFARIAKATLAMHHADVILFRVFLFIFSFYSSISMISTVSIAVCTISSIFSTSFSDTEPIFFVEILHCCITFPRLSIFSFVTRPLSAFS